MRGEKSNRMGSPTQGSFLRLQESHFLKRACVLSHVSPVRLFATLWTVAHQAFLSMRFSRQDYWSGLSCPPPGDLSNPGIEPPSPGSPASQADSLPLGPLRKPLSKRFKKKKINTSTPDLPVDVETAALRVKWAQRDPRPGGVGAEHRLQQEP